MRDDDIRDGIRNQIRQMDARARMVRFGCAGLCLLAVIVCCGGFSMFSGRPSVVTIKPDLARFVGTYRFSEEACADIRDWGYVLMGDGSLTFSQDGRVVVSGGRLAVYDHFDYDQEAEYGIIIPEGAVEGTWEFADPVGAVVVLLDYSDSEGNSVGNISLFLVRTSDGNLSLYPSNDPEFDYPPFERQE
ncbi:MAG: hypothetical protein R3C18_08515 [Planctomycetaceae bacterium]